MEKHYLYGGEAELEYQENPWHRYFFDGNRLCSSTGVGGLLDKSGPLMGWAVKMALEVIEERFPVGSMVDEVTLSEALSDARAAPKKRTSKAADLGTLVHEWYEAWVVSQINGDTPPPRPTNAKIRQAAEYILEWFDLNVEEFVFAERKILSREHLFAGTSDVGFISKANRAAVSDYKTGNYVLNAYGKEAGKIYTSIALQMSSYVGALAEEGVIQTPEETDRWVLHCSSKTGQFKAYNLAEKGQPWYTDWREDWECFLELRKVHRRVKGY